MVFICASLIIINDEQFFMCLKAVDTPSLETSTRSSAHFLIECFFVTELYELFVCFGK